MLRGAGRRGLLRSSVSSGKRFVCLFFRSLGGVLRRLAALDALIRLFVLLGEYRQLTGLFVVFLRQFTQISATRPGRGFVRRIVILLGVLVLERIARFVQDHQQVAAVRVGRGQRRIVFHRLAEVVERLVELATMFVGDTASVVGLGVFGIVGNRRVEEVDRLVGRIKPVGVAELLHGDRIRLAIGLLESDFVADQFQELGLDPLTARASPRSGNRG